MHSQSVSSAPPPSIVACPSCGGRQLRSFYAVDQIPCHSVLLMETSAQAIDYPRADLRLAFCEGCGFITNTLFDARHNAYSQSYEETQHFSSLFNAFAKGLIADLIERFGVRHKRVLEIGCGKGEFLGLLCEQGDNQGIGIDPSCRPDRIPAAWRDRMQIINDIYSPRHAEIEADVIVCRHTLEHIGPTQEFLQLVRDSIGDRHETLFFFEVPDVRIVLEQCRFWDIYYEHCSYFSLGSLARLFRACRFEILSLERGFDNQYALLVSRPSANVTRPSFSTEDDIDELNQLVDLFGRRAPHVVREWQARIRDWRHLGQKIAVWGAGSKCVAFLTTIGIDREVSAVVDINPHKHGRFLPGTGHIVMSPEKLLEHPVDIVLLMNSVYESEVRRNLEDLGLTADLVSV